MRTVPALLLSIVLALVVAAPIATPLEADAQAGGPVAPRSEPVAGFSGLLDSDFNVFRARVWAIEQIGDTVYVGGRFTTARNGPGLAEFSQPALVAIDADTGRLITSFTPDIRGGGVYDLLASPDGSRLFVAGEFDSVGGAAQTAGLAAIDPDTGDLDPTWRAGLEERRTSDYFVNAGPDARTLAIRDGRLYVAGSFTHLVSGGTTSSAQSVGRVSVSTGAPDTSWRPNVQGGGVWDLAISPVGGRVYLAGYFTSVNGVTVPSFTAVRTADGQLSPGLQALDKNEPGARYHAVAAVGDRVFVAGEQHALHVLDATDLDQVALYYTGSPVGNPLDGGGDFQALHVAGDVVYAGCHCWEQLFVPDDPTALYSPSQVQGRSGTWSDVAAVVALDTSGRVLGNHGLAASGQAGAWAIESTTDGCLWAGGGFSQSDGQWLSDLGRWCPDVDGDAPVVPQGFARFGLETSTNRVGDAPAGSHLRGLAPGQRTDS